MGSIQHPHLDPTIEAKVKTIEDAVTHLQEQLAMLVFIAKRDHPDLWPPEEDQVVQTLQAVDDQPL